MVVKLIKTCTDVVLVEFHVGGQCDREPLYNFMAPLMRQSAYVHPKFFWAMVCRRIKQLLRKNLYEIEKKLGRFISKSPVLLLLLHMKSSLKVTQRAER